MRHEIRLSVIFLIVFAAGVLSQPLPAQDKSVKITFTGGLDNIFSYGSEQDYVFGINDFPVTPDHRTFYLGGSLHWMLSPRIGIGVSGRYVLPTSIVLTDPSDGDQVEINSAAHWSAVLNGVYYLTEGPFRPYVRLGGGIDKLASDAQTAVTDYGFEASFGIPEDSLDLMFIGAAGTEFALDDTWGIILELRYTHIFSDPDNVQSAGIVLGLNLNI